jgi:hypothetical protein
MALASTTLAGACTSYENTINVTTATGFVAGSYCQVDSEIMKIMAVNGTSIDVSRGVRGTLAVAHTVYALVCVGTAAEFAAVTSGGSVGPFALKPRIYTYAVAGAITIAPGIHRIGAGAAEVKAMTLASPSYGEDGIRLTFETASAYAHTVDCTAGFMQNTSSSNLATLAATVGSSFTVLAMGGKWIVESSSNTGTSTVSVAFS